MRILMMAQHYAPEDVGGARLATEMAVELVHKGHQVKFVTCAPNHPAGRVYEGYRNSLLSRQKTDGVDVLRVWSYISPQKTTLRRLLNYGTFSAAAFYGGIAAGRPDVIFSYSPPLPLGLTAWLLSCWWGVPWILRVEDLFPQAAVAAGVLQNQMMIRFFEALEKFLYRKATHISLISAAFRRNLLKRGIPDGKLSIAPVWADPEQIVPLEKNNGFRREFDLWGKFVILYAGNLGHTSALDDVLSVAEVLRADPSFCFIFVGEGVKKPELQRQAHERKLSNVLFLPYQPRGRYPELLAAADVGLVTINADAAESSLPSKVFNIMASGRPVLSIAPPHSDLASLIEQFSCGINVPPGQIQALVDAIKSLQTDPMRVDKFGCNSRRALVENFSRSRILPVYENMFSEIAKHGNIPVEARSM